MSAASAGFGLTWACSLPSTSEARARRLRLAAARASRDAPEAPPVLQCAAEVCTLRTEVHTALVALQGVFGGCLFRSKGLQAHPHTCT